MSVFPKPYTKADLFVAWTIGVLSGFFIYKIAERIGL